MESLTLEQLCRDVASRLQPRYGQGEAQWMVRIMMRELKGYSQIDLAVKARNPVSDFFRGKTDDTVKRLLQGEPIQYIFGVTDFYGLRLHVSPDVLIPRPETAELVDIIVKENSSRSDLSVLDVCTGSGCIAVALARNLPFSKVEAIDISAPALEIARRNAAELKVRIDFLQADALKLAPETSPQFDIIVSNPPYVLDSERRDMEANVLAHEPALALFVPDDDPLRFYTSIARYALPALKPEGRLYFEVNPLTVEQLAKEMRADGWDNVSVLPDSSRRRRFLSAIRP